MKEINWDDITKFKKDDFPEDADKFAEPELIYRLNFFRIKLKKHIFPSTVVGALARFDNGNSRHTVKLNRKSKAVDVFPEGIAIETYLFAMSLGLFNGIGMYLDTIGLDGKPWVMFHLDIRNVGYDYGNPLIWIGEKVKIGKKYVTKLRYPQYDPKYWKLFQNDKFYSDKKFGS